MLNAIRILFSVALYITGIFLIVDMIQTGFHWGVIVGCILCFFLAYIVWPSGCAKKEGNYDFLELIELLIELPYRAVAGLIRGVGRIFKSGDGLDVDF